MFLLYVCGWGGHQAPNTPKVQRPCMVGGHFFFCVPGRKSSLCVSRQEEFGTLVDGMYVRGCHLKNYVFLNLLNLKCQVVEICNMRPMLLISTSCHVKFARLR